MQLIGSLRNLALVGSLALLTGLTVGFVLGYRMDDSVPEQEVRAIRVEVIKSIDDTAKAEVALEEKREQVRTQIKYVTKEVIKHVPATESLPVDCRLSVGAVGLLNAARTGADVQPAPDLDAQSQAPSAIGLRELSESDTEIAGQYRELAADHDALVEYVEQYQKRLNEYQQQ